MATHRIARAAALLTLVAALPALSGCALLFNEKTKWKFTKRFTIPADKASRVDQYGALLGKKSKPGDSPFGIAVAPFSFWAPFEFGVSTGIFDLERREATLGSGSCLEVDEEGIPLGTNFHFVCAEYLIDGALVYNSLDTQQQFYQGVNEVDLAFEANGVDLLFKARPRFTANWDIVTSVPFAAQTMAWNASIGGVDLGKKGEIGWDAFFATNGASPNVPTLDDQLELASFDALDHAGWACNDLDGDPVDPFAPPDFTAAAVNLGLAIDSLDAAILEAGQFPESKDRDKGIDRLVKARKQYDKALAKIGQGKEKPAGRKIRKGMDEQFDGLLRITPFPVEF